MNTGDTVESALILGLHPCQKQGGISSGDPVLKQGSSVSEMFILVGQLVSVFIVGVDMFIN